MKSPTMEGGVKNDQGYESYDSLSACGSERRSSLSDTEFDPTSDDDEDDYSKPGLQDGDIDDLSEQFRHGATLVSRAPMKNIDNVRDTRRENAQPWSVRTQNSVTPSGGRVISLQAQRNVLTGNLQALTSNLQTQSTMTGNLQLQNIMNHTMQPQNVITSTHQRNDLNITTKNKNVTSNNFISKNLTGNNLANNSFLGKNLSNNNDIYTGSGLGKNLPSYEVANKHLPATTNVSGNNLVSINVQPPSVSSDELADELQDLTDYPELQEFARFRAEEENSSGTDYTEYIRHLFTDTLPELSAADVNEGFGQLDKSDFGKISPLSFSSTIVPPSVDSFPSSPADSYLLAALADADALEASLNAAQGNVSVVPDFISILRTGDSSGKQNTSGNLLTASVPTTTNYSNLVTSTSEYSTYTSSTNCFLDIHGHNSAKQNTSGNLPASVATNSNYSNLVTSTSEYSTYTSSSNSFLDIRGQRGSFSTSSTPSHPGSVEYSPQSSADSQPSPHSDLELYQQFSPNIIPVTVNDDLGEDDGSRLDNTTAKERLLQKIRADAALKKAKDVAWLAASKTDPEKLITAIQDLCRTVDNSVEAKFYANMEVFIDNATQEQIIQLFECVRFQRCANVVNNPLLSAYVCEIMLDRGVE